MKKLLFSLLCLLAVPSFAQTALTVTTLSGSIGSSQTNLPVASASGIFGPNAFGGASQTAGTATLLYIDNEAMFVKSVSGTLVQVQRGANGTAASGHNVGAIVFVGNPIAFLAGDPSGQCTAANTYSPTIVTASATFSLGHYWNCVGTGTVGTWYPVLSTGAITPAASAATIGTFGQTFTLRGVAVGEPVVIASAPPSTSLCPLVGASVLTANTVTLYFSTLTAAACTPAAGTYLINLPRFSL